ncbi:protein FAR1-RELATED SEQUENCE 7-like [Bidens hawaiensis]|uniref:protein FAR1-RELATED SEQUENCE 7-like n=1 Tax=Bidens hawaiensis TaxID=980011 RepID=UPI00404A3871
MIVQQSSVTIQRFRPPYTIFLRHDLFTDPSSDLVILQVNAFCKPVKGMIFEYVDHAYDFYCEYAKKAGFCVRKGGSYMNDSLLKSKYFTCSKEGHKPANSYDSMAEKDGSNRPYYKRRKRPTIRCGCRAQIFLKSDDGLRFEINDFVQGHNHELVDAKDVHFVRSNRKLTHVKQDIIYEMSTLNLGPVKVFNIMRTKYGGFEEVGAKKNDCKNFKRSLTCYIGEYDAEMVVQRLSGKKNSCDGYSFEYTVNTNGELDRLFWADEISKKKYLSFGDIISFDATFKTNKYNMVFVPFTTINNHCLNVTVGVALLSSESIESYSWLLKFLSLVEFFSHFDHCMEIQRHNGRKNDHDTRYTHPDPVSETPFEKEAELISGVVCLKSTKEEDFVRFSVFDFNTYVPGCLEVLFKKEGEEGIDSTISCGCKIFEHYGLLCRHSLYILILFRVTRFPKKYMVDRWKRDAGVNPRTAPISTFGNDKYLKVKEISREITLADEYLINSYATDVDELTKVRDQMNIMIKQADETRYKRTHLTKRDRFVAILGYDQPSEVTVRVPSGIKNKGCGSHKRIKAQKEIAISRSGKKYRECKVCHKQGHNSRTCPQLQEE